MKSKKHRWLSLLLCVTMLLTMSVTPVYAEEDIGGQDGQNAALEETGTEPSEQAAEPSAVVPGTTESVAEPVTEPAGEPAVSEPETTGSETTGTEAAEQAAKPETTEPEAAANEPTAPAEVKTLKSSGPMAPINAPEHVHDFNGGRGIDKKANTCTEDGYYIQYWVCGSCKQRWGEVRKNYPKLGHDWGETQTVHGSYKVRFCKRCGEAETVSGGTPTHTYGNTVYTQEVTCTADGYQYKECTDPACKARQIDESTRKSALGHDSMVNVGRREVEGGYYDIFKCKREGCDYKQEIFVDTTKCSHHYATRRTKEPTCTDTGMEETYCTKCGEVLEGSQRVVSALGHDYKYKTIKAATCTAEGSAQEICSRCGATGQTKTLPKLQHKYEETVTKEATCTEKGTKEMLCVNCGEKQPGSKETEIPALGHKEEADDGDCSTPVKCSRCGEEMVAAKEHVFNLLQHDNEYHWYECGNVGCHVTNGKAAHIRPYSAEDDCTKDYRCQNCDALVKGKAVHQWKTEYVSDSEGHWEKKVCTNPYCNQTTGEDKNTKKAHDLVVIDDCTTGVCKVCGGSFPTGAKHNYQVNKDRNEPTKHWLECQNEGCKQEYSYPHVGDSKDCTKAGTCTQCGYTFGTAMSKTHDFVALAGTDTHRCMNPGCTVKETHTWGAPEEKITDSTCAAVGKKETVERCEGCGLEKVLETEEIAKKEHTWVVYDEQAPTCVEKGYESRYCKVCQKVEKKIEKPATGKHVWGASFDWKVSREGGKLRVLVTPTFVCQTCKKTVPEAQREATIIPAKDPDGESDSCMDRDRLTTCTVTVEYEGQTFTGNWYMQPEGYNPKHKWKDPVFEWSENYESAMAVFVCERSSDHVERVPVEVSKSEPKEPTCMEDGSITYTIKKFRFDGKDYGGEEETKELERLGHKWKMGSGVTFNWGPDYKTATATRVCERDKTHTETVNAEVKQVKTYPATCVEAGYEAYTATATFSDGMMQTDRISVSLPKTGHKWGEPKFEWASDFSLVRVVFSCENENCSQQQVILISDSDIVKKTDVEPTCETAGNNVYTVTVEWDGKTYTDTEEENIPALGHDWGKDPVFSWSEDHTSAVATFTCTRDQSHKKEAEAEVSAEVIIKPDCTTEGSAVYTAMVVFEGETYTASEKAVLPALGHDWKDGKCTRCGATKPAEPEKKPADTGKKPAETTVAKTTQAASAPRTGDAETYTFWLILCGLAGLAVLYSGKNLRMKNK